MASNLFLSFPLKNITIVILVDGKSRKETTPELSSGRKLKMVGTKVDEGRENLSNWIVGGKSLEYKPNGLLDDYDKLIGNSSSNKHEMWIKGNLKKRKKKGMILKQNGAEEKIRLEESKEDSKMPKGRRLVERCEHRNANTYKTITVGKRFALVHC